MLSEDAAAPELRLLLRLVCPTLRKREGLRALPLPVVPAEDVRGDLGADLASARKRSSPSHCFDVSSSRREAPSNAPAIFVAMHGASSPESAVLLAHAVWAEVCEFCKLRCVHSRSMLRRLPVRQWDVLIDHETVATPAAIAAAMSAGTASLAPRALRLVHSSSPQFSASLTFHERGGVLASVSRSELTRAHLPETLAAANVPEAAWISHPMDPLANDSRKEYAAGWRRIVAGVGMLSPVADEVVSIAAALRARWVSGGYRDGGVIRWLGCFNDLPAARAMTAGPRSFGHTTQACAASCTGYNYFALQSGQCCCARTLSRSANHSKVADAKCGRVCPTEEGKTPVRLCGSSWRNAVYSTSVGHINRVSGGRSMSKTA